VIEAIEAGFFQREIADASYRYQRSLEAKDRVVVGVNAFEREETPGDLNLLKIGRESNSGKRARCSRSAVRATVLRWKPRWRSSNARAAPTKT